MTVPPADDLQRLAAAEAEVLARFPELAAPVRAAEDLFLLSARSRPATDADPGATSRPAKASPWFALIAAGPSGALLAALAGRDLPWLVAPAVLGGLLIGLGGCVLVLLTRRSWPRPRAMPGTAATPALALVGALGLVIWLGNGGSTAGQPLIGIVAGLIVGATLVCGVVDTRRARRAAALTVPPVDPRELASGFGAKLDEIVAAAPAAVRDRFLVARREAVGRLLAEGRVDAGSVTDADFAAPPGRFRLTAALYQVLRS